MGAGVSAWPWAITITTAGRMYMFLISAETAFITITTMAHLPMLRKKQESHWVDGQQVRHGEIMTMTDYSIFSSQDTGNSIETTRLSPAKVVYHPGFVCFEESMFCVV